MLACQGFFASDPLLLLSSPRGAAVNPRTPEGEFQSGSRNKDLGPHARGIDIPRHRGGLSVNPTGHLNPDRLIEEDAPPPFDFKLTGMTSDVNVLNLEN